MIASASMVMMGTVWSAMISMNALEIATVVAKIPTVSIFLEVISVSVRKDSSKISLVTPALSIKPFLDRVLTLTNVMSEVIIVKAIKNAKISKALINASVALALSRITTMYYLMMHQRVWTIMNVVMVNMTVVRTEPVLTRLGHIRVNVILDFLAMVLNALTQMNVQKIVTLATHLPTALIQRLKEMPHLCVTLDYIK